jgi:hypothetical protein
MPNAMNRLCQKAAELLAFEDDDDSNKEVNGVMLILI